MSRTLQVKAALLTVLLGAALLAQPRLSSGVVALLAFGALNIVATPPRTLWIRAVSIVAALLGLVDPTKTMIIVVLAVFFWPPAFMLSWSLADERLADEMPAAAPHEPAAERARWTLVVLIVTVAVASIAYRAIVWKHLDQSAALFVGLPALMAVLVTIGASPRTASGVAFKATTIGLLLSMVCLWEGALCVAMSAPIFYAVAVGIAKTIDRSRSAGQTTIASFVLLVAVAPMSLEGVTPVTTLNRSESVSASKIVHASAAEVERAVFEPPRFERGRPRPLFLRLGLPTPAASRLERSGGSLRLIVRIRGGEMLLNGMESRAGDLVLDVEDTRPGLVRWRAVSDTSHLTHFLTFRESIVEWEPIDTNTTKVTWTLRYDRGLDPAWYFGPMERYAVSLSADYLIDTVATP